MSIPHLPFTEQQLLAMGLPPRHEHGFMSYLLFGGHYTASFVESLEALEVIELGAVGSIGYSVAGLAYATAEGLHEINEAHEAGDALAHRNAWKTGFASALAAFARGRNWHSSNARYLNEETLGRNAATRLVNGMTRQ